MAAGNAGGPPQPEGDPMRAATDSMHHNSSAHVDEPANPASRPSPSAPGRTRPGQRRSRVPAVAFGAVVALLLATGTACSSSTTTSPTTAAATSAAASPTAASGPAGKEQICAARDQLQTSVGALINPALLTGGTAAIKGAVDKVQSDLDAVKTAGKQDYATEVDALQTSLQQLQTAVGKMGDGNAASNLQAVGTAIAATGTAAEALLTKLTAACG